MIVFCIRTSDNVTRYRRAEDLIAVDDHNDRIILSFRSADGGEDPIELTESDAVCDFRKALSEMTCGTTFVEPQVTMIEIGTIDIGRNLAPSP